METGVIDLAELDGDFDLQSTLESGQSYLWGRLDGQMYDRDGAFGGDAWYQTVVPPLDGVSDESAVVRARQVDGGLEWASNTDAVPILRSLLRLDDDLDAVVEAMPDEPLVARAYEAYPGMRIVRDPPFGCLVSFICSAQMRVSRIFDMQERLREAYGEKVEFDGETYRAYPTPERLAEATEDDLRDLRLGYRAPYVQRTAEMVASGEATPAGARGLDYEEARDYLTTFVGVGDKVADCVLLFSLDYLEAVPLDTWIHTAIDEYYPECDRGNYRETSRAIRERLGGDIAGYTQTYVFHYLRSGGE
ncbi:DNA-3-methyladenine glycosylase family protein [Haloferax namakaokahaiae]|uniref:DNA-(apurinic or apyrimidinic site) lyase n=1 Tax=Haloferax namakaokahaiae TaxID=1748331 RepID=A0ABD5ZDV1_9EURY